MDLKHLACKLRDDPECEEAQVSNLKEIILDIAEVLIAASALIPNLLIKNALLAIGSALKMLADHMS